MQYMLLRITPEPNVKVSKRDSLNHTVFYADDR